LIVRELTYFYLQ